MFGMIFIAGLFFVLYVEIVTFFENRRDAKRISEYFKNRG